MVSPINIKEEDENKDFHFQNIIDNQNWFCAIYLLMVHTIAEIAYHVEGASNLEYYTIQYEKQTGLRLIGHKFFMYIITIDRQLITQFKRTAMISQNVLKLIKCSSVAYEMLVKKYHDQLYSYCRD